MELIPVSCDRTVHEAWTLLRTLAAGLTRVNLLDAHNTVIDGGMHQHRCPTLVACLRGVVRINSADGNHDLTPGAVLLVRPGAWHQHLPLRPGSLALGQGFIAGKSDVLIDAVDRKYLSSIPEQPSRNLMEEALAANDPRQRLRIVAGLLTGLIEERHQPLTAPAQALLTFEMALWRNLHQRDALALSIRQSGASRATIYRLCHETWDQPPAAVLRRTRQGLARTLHQQGLPGEEICRRCGFTSAATLAAALRNRPAP